MAFNLVSFRKSLSAFIYLGLCPSLPSSIYVFVLVYLHPSISMSLSAFIHLCLCPSLPSSICVLVPLCLHPSLPLRWSDGSRGAYPAIRFSSIVWPHSDEENNDCKGVNGSKKAW